MFIFGYQLSAITPDILGILKNTEILAINQDPVVGKSVSPFRWGINVGSPLSTCALLTCPSLTGQVTAVSPLNIGVDPLRMAQCLCS